MKEEVVAPILQTRWFTRSLLFSASGSPERRQYHTAQAPRTMLAKDLGKKFGRAVAVGNEAARKRPRCRGQEESEFSLRIKSCVQYIRREITIGLLL
jgi:hypothetical protein